MMKGLIMKQVRFLAGVVLVLLFLGSLTAAQAQTEKNKQIAVAFYNHYCPNVLDITAYKLL